MQEGRIEVEGDAGDRLGGPWRGERSGMRGGRVVIHGNTGRQTGHRLRRGSIIVNGCAGPECGLEMVAGTIAVNRIQATDVGFAMRRGTILIGDPPAMLGQDREASCFAPPSEAPAFFLKMLLADLARDFPLFSDRLNDSWWRSVGNLSAGGLGEILW